MIKITLISPLDCDHCAEIRAMLEVITKDYPDIEFEEIDAASQEGQSLIIKHGIMQSPGILINDEFFAMGAVSKNELHNKFDQFK